MTQRQLSKLDLLINRVRELTEIRGKKSELARYLGKPPQRVNDWLSGDVMPSGEVTLQLLEWVQAEEAKQQKALGSVEATTKDRKTRQPNHSHEKSNRVRKGK